MNSERVVETGRTDAKKRAATKAGCPWPQWREPAILLLNPAAVGTALSTSPVWPLCPSDFQQSGRSGVRPCRNSSPLRSATSPRRCAGSANGDVIGWGSGGGSVRSDRLIRWAARPHAKMPGFPRTARVRAGQSHSATGRSAPSPCSTTQTGRPSDLAPLAHDAPPAHQHL